MDDSPATIPHEPLIRWAATHQTVRRLYIFGSRASGAADPNSDLDVAFELDVMDEQLAELIENAARWKQELSEATGLRVKDLRLRSDEIVTGPIVLVYDREEIESTTLIS